MLGEKQTLGYIKIIVKLDYNDYGYNKLTAITRTKN